MPQIQLGVAYIHIGTHKTGTTSIQAFLSANEARFAASGIVLPSAGRIQPAFAAQTNIAWELTGDWTYDARRGTFAEMLAEIAASGLPTACCSSEEFDTLHLHPEALARFVAGFRSIGYDPRIIVYLRPQADYAESLYAELVRGGHRVSFEQLIDGIVGAARTYAPRFEYREMLRDFAKVFGRQSVSVRAYDSSVAADTILRDFTSIVGRHSGAPDFATLELPGRLNERQTFGDVFRKVMGSQPSPALEGLAANGIFDPLTLADIARIAGRFRRPNACIAKLYGARIACISPGRLRRELLTALGLDSGARKRKRWFKAARSKIPVGTAPPNESTM